LLVAAMLPTKANSPLLDAAQAAFLGGPVAINVASHDAARVPSIARAFGCRVSDDRREVVVFLSQPRSRRILDDLAAGAPIAAVFSRPATRPFTISRTWAMPASYSAALCRPSQGALQLPIWYSRQRLNFFFAMFSGERS